MRPLPTTPENLPAAGPKKPAATEGRVLKLHAKTSNTRRSGSSCPTQRAYPWLLVTSTVMAGVFCFLYINKPVIIAESSAKPSPALAASPTPEIQKKSSIEKATPATNSDTTSEDKTAKPRATEPQQLAGNGSAYEETNLRIQHVLGAQSKQGEDLGRVILDVPVLYQSGAVRWTRDDVDKARSLLTRIGSYQEKSRALREEAVHLISEWDQLIVDSIPDDALRADSRTLPENQGIGAADNTHLNTTDSIEIEKP